MGNGLETELLPQYAGNCILRNERQKPEKAKFADLYRITLFFF
jgi:hypothetical protein